MVVRNKMCGVRRSQVRKLRQAQQSMTGPATEKQLALLSGILGQPLRVIQGPLSKGLASYLIDSVSSGDDTPDEDKAMAGPYGIY